MLTGGTALKSFRLLLVLLAAIFVLAACDDDDDVSPTVTTTGEDIAGSWTLDCVDVGVAVFRAP